MRNTILVGDVRTRLQELPDESVHCVVTSPPYWGLRDYGVDGQFGLEATPEEYVANMVAVFRDVRRVLRKDGTCWLNLGDSYAGSGKGPSNGEVKQNTNAGSITGVQRRHVQQFANGQAPTSWLSVPAGLKQKDLVGIPWMVAFALRADGWYLRRDIIWAKPNPMPESVTDRPTSSHEYLFLLAKSEQYFYDAFAIREKSKQPLRRRRDHVGGVHHPQHSPGGLIEGSAHRNKRSVWEINTEPYKKAHFATFPKALVRPCIQAGTSEHGCCSVCGAPWERVLERSGSAYGERTNAGRIALARQAARQKHAEYVDDVKSVGWAATCQHHQPGAGFARPLVLDPFLGSGTTALVAKLAGRDYVGIELSPDYAAMAKDRIRTNQERLF